MAYVSPLAGPMAAVIAGPSKQMDHAAQRGLTAVRNVAAAHRLTGNYLSKLSVVTAPSEKPSKVGTVQDRLIVADDEAAVSIEYGHMIRYKNARRVRYVPGQHIMGRAIRMVI